MAPEITRIDLTTFDYPVPDVNSDPRRGHVYDPGHVARRETFAVRIHTDEGVAGEYVGGNPMGIEQAAVFADYLVGENPLKREYHWSEMKRALRKYDRIGMGPIDVALWDLAGKRAGDPIHALLGTYRDRLPAYASTQDGDLNGGLDSPEAFADFAEECLEVGYPGFKIHPWGGEWYDRDRLIETIHAVGERVDDEMDLMLDPFCNPRTFAEAVTVGRACDEQGYLWLEDPYHDGGIAQEGHRKLGALIDTPILQGEHVRGFEPHTDFVANDATDFIRADPGDDAGITGAMKIARMAEGFGIDVEYHGCGPARRHCMAATRNSNYYEVVHVHPAFGAREPPYYAGDYTDAFEAIADDGTFPVPDGPGLGVAYDWDYVEDNATATRTFE